MPICPECRAGYDEQSECPECGMPAPELKMSGAPIRKSSLRCSPFGAFCILAAWLGSVVVLVLFIIATFNSASTFTEWGLALLTAILHLGVCYALWLAFNLAIDRQS